MKHFLFFISILLCLYSCSQDDAFSDLKTTPTANTRAAGDSEYDVLGYGYDVTGEYLHPLSVRNPVIDIQKYKKDYPNRLIVGTSSFGYDQMYYGYSASDYIKDIAKTTSVDASFSKGLGEKNDDKNSDKNSDKNTSNENTALFSGNIKYNNYLKTEYEYSDKYSFASVDAIRNRKLIRINDEINRLSKYLSDDFVEDLNRLSPDRLVERYGTHVLTDFVIGGRYKLMFRSVITHSKDAAHKKTTVGAGLKATLSKIGFSLNASRTVETNETLIKDNQSKELYVIFYGGNGTSLKYDLEKGLPAIIDVQSWENSLNLSNSCLNEIVWKETYPIYEFINDPVKKEAVKNAVMSYIELSKLNELKLLPLHQYYSEKYVNHSYTPNYMGEVNNTDHYQGVIGYICSEQVKGTIPLYQYYSEKYVNHSYTTKYMGLVNNTDHYEGIIGYIHKDMSLETTPLYLYYSEKYTNHSLATFWRGLKDGSDKYECTLGYIYPAN